MSSNYIVSNNDFREGNDLAKQIKTLQRAVAMERGENHRFKDANGNPIKRYECKITHVNNGREQAWTVSKTVCLQIIEQLRKGFTVLKVTRHGEDRTTTYQIEAMQ
ncbi:hypothetical protein BH18THE2_BH18THE2_14400 [soil metagenome]